jgi:hypothetical protein
MCGTSWCRLFSYMKIGVPQVTQWQALIASTAASAVTCCIKYHAQVLDGIACQHYAISCSPAPRPKQQSTLRIPYLGRRLSTAGMHSCKTCYYSWMNSGEKDECGHGNHDPKVAMVIMLHRESFAVAAPMIRERKPSKKATIHAAGCLEHFERVLDTLERGISSRGEE